MRGVSHMAGDRVSSTVIELDGFSQVEEGAGKIQVRQQRYTHFALHESCCKTASGVIQGGARLQCRGGLAIWQSQEMWRPLLTLPGTVLALWTSGNSPDCHCATWRL